MTKLYYERLDTEEVLPEEERLPMTAEAVGAAYDKLVAEGFKPGQGREEFIATHADPEAQPTPEADQAKVIDLGSRATLAAFAEAA